MKLPTRAGWTFVAFALGAHVRRKWAIYVASAVLAVWTHQNYRIGINVSESLPDRIFVVALGERPSQPGQYVAFEWRRHEFYRYDRLFTKMIVGVPGQAITVVDGAIYVDGTLVARAKRKTRRGLPLEPIEAGVIPQGHYFVLATHKDSLDSRYKVTGLVSEDRIVGRAYVLL